LGSGGKREYEEERLVHQRRPIQKQVEAMLQKSNRPRLTGKETLPSRQNGKEEDSSIKTEVPFPNREDSRFLNRKDRRTFSES